jgi:hypothetical protein
MSLITTIIVGISLLSVLIGLDFYLAFDGMKGNTWSEILRSWGAKNALTPWIWCGLAGHFFHWSKQSRPILHPPSNIALLVWLTALVFVVSVAMTRAGMPIPSWVVAPVAFVAWAILWPV